MESGSSVLDEWLVTRIPKLAAQAHRRFPLVPAEDFEQAMWVRALERKAKLTRLLREGRDGLAWNELRSAATRLGKEDDRERRAAKAAAEGYKPWDEEFYSAGVLAQLLTALSGAESVAEVIEQATNNTDAAGIHISTSDPDSSGNYMVMLIDVQTALGKLRRGDQRILQAYYGLGVEDTEEGRWERRKLASSMGLTYEALRQRVFRALRALQDELGGDSPWRRQDKDAA
jgi:hypothetical protein